MMPKMLGFVGDPKSAKLGPWRNAEMGQMLKKITLFGGIPTLQKKQCFWSTSRVRTGILRGPSAAKKGFF